MAYTMIRLLSEKGDIVTIPVEQHYQRLKISYKFKSKSDMMMLV